MGRWLLPGAEGTFSLPQWTSSARATAPWRLMRRAYSPTGVKGLGILLGLGKVKGAEAGDAHGVHKVYVGLAHDDAAVAALGAGLQLAVGEVPGIRVLNNEPKAMGALTMRLR